jgi:hypothetical protein
MSQKIEQGDGAGANPTGGRPDNDQVSSGTPEDLYERLGEYLDNGQLEEASDLAKELWILLINLAAETPDSHGRAVEGPHHQQTDELMRRAKRSAAQMHAYMRFFT